ncbi:MAG: hypothetical protein ACI9UH_001151 [Gammaproteobacteria bacterium]|jgi:hypothetical protein
MYQIKRSKFAFIASSLIFTSLISNQVSAGWWDDAVSTVKSSGGDEILEAVINPGLSDDALSLEDMSKGFKQALTIGSEKVVARLGQVDGFNADPSAHIPLPKNLEKVRKALSKVGLSSYVDDLELKLNRAAEAATPVAKQLFIDSISTMSFDDVKRIYQGPKDSATRFFETKMSPSLSLKMQPIVDRSLSEVGAINAYDQVIKKYQDIPFVPDIKADLSKHVIDKGMAAIFHYIAQEEAAIRNDPLRQTSELLKKVFGAK